MIVVLLVRPSVALLTVTPPLIGTVGNSHVGGFDGSA